MPGSLRALCFAAGKYKAYDKALVAEGGTGFARSQLISYGKQYAYHRRYVLILRKNQDEESQ